MTMNRIKDAHNVGTPEKLRGQEMGRPGYKDQKRKEMQNTPALKGNLKTKNKMFADNSYQHVGANASSPRANSPSTPGALPGDVKLGESGGEKAFNKRHSRRGSTD
jgi:hypothetical protein